MSAIRRIILRHGPMMLARRCDIGTDGGPVRVKAAAPIATCDQEQIQMITMVMGTAAPNAPPIIIANADSSLASVCSSYPDMPLLHRAPAPRGKVDRYG